MLHVLNANRHNRLAFDLSSSDPMTTYKHPACLEIEQLAGQCDFQRTRSGGPGGQHRNKVETAIVVKHKPTGVTGQAGERRSQHANRTVALERLRVNLAIEIRSKSNFESPSERWQGRCRGGKISVSRQHFDFACLLAEALDQIEAAEFQLAAAAKQLGCSTTQLINLIKKEDQALVLVNKMRQQNGLGRIK